MIAKGFCLLLLVCFVFGHAFTEELVIDDFVNGEDIQFVSVRLTSTINSSDPPQSGSDLQTFTNCTDLFGCSREIEIIVTEGQSGRRYEADVWSSYSPPTDPYNHFDFPAELWLQSPHGGQETTTLRYTSATGVDLTVGGAGTDFFMAGGSDSDSDVIVTLTDSSSISCSANVHIYDYGGSYYDPYESLVSVPLTSFTGCDLTDITDIEVLFDIPSSVDYVIRRISITSAPPAEEDKIVIDTMLDGAYYSVYHKMKSTLYPSQPPVIVDDTYIASSGCTDLLGCQRYVELAIYKGRKRRIFEAEFFTVSTVTGLADGELYISTASNSDSDVTLVYDNISSFDLTAAGTAHRIKIIGGSDVGTVVDVAITDSSAVTCVSEIYLPPSSTGVTSVARSFEAFGGGCDFTSVDEVKFVFNCGSSSDIDIQSISVTGPV